MKMRIVALAVVMAGSIFGATINSLGDCPHWVKSERKWRKVRDFKYVL